MLKRLFALLLLAALASSAHAQISLGGEADSNTNGTSGSVTLTVSGTSPLLTAICIARNGGSFTDITDDRSQTYTLVMAATADGATRVAIGYVQNAAAGSTTISCNGASDTWLVHGAYWPGAHTTAAFVEADSQLNATVTTHPAGDVGVDAAAGGLIISACGQSSTITDETVATNYTALTQTTGGANRQWWQYRLASGTLTDETAAYTASSHNSNCQIASFAEAGGGGSSTTTQTMHLQRLMNSE